jgi:hypothetical protein
MICATTLQYQQQQQQLKAVVVSSTIYMMQQQTYTSLQGNSTIVTLLTLLMIKIAAVMLSVNTDEYNSVLQLCVIELLEQLDIVFTIDDTDGRVTVPADSLQQYVARAAGAANG